VTAINEHNATNDERVAAAVRQAGAMRIVRRYTGASAIAGLNPVPVLDVAVLGGVHVSLIKDLSDHYGAEFSEHTARNILIAIAASIVPGAIGSVLGRKMLGALPFVTHGAGLLTMSVFSAGVSYGLGLVFIRHFEAGGTLDSFNADNLHKIFRWSPA
jgi:uncharacterized protein (DUF697 family)